MPIYEYLCSKCAHVFEEFVRPSELHSFSAKCPHCEDELCERLPSAHGGYKMNSGPSSVRPKNAGSFKVKK